VHVPFLTSMVSFWRVIIATSSIDQHHVNVKFFLGGSDTIINADTSMHLPYPQ